MKKIRIINRWTPVDIPECTLNPVSQTIEDQALSVRELFQRYVEGTLDKQVLIQQKRAEYDDYEGHRRNLTYDDYVPDLDAVGYYEASIVAKEKAELRKTADVPPADTPLVDAPSPSTSGDNTGK